MMPHWDIGPAVAALTLRVTPGMPAVWAIGAVEGYLPVNPVFEVLLRDGTVYAFPAPGGIVQLPAEVTQALASGRKARIVDGSTVVAAGLFAAQTGWESTEPAAAMPARVVAAPPPSFTAEAVPLPAGAAPTATIGGTYPDLTITIGIPAPD